MRLNNVFDILYCHGDHVFTKLCINFVVNDETAKKQFWNLNH